MGLDERLYFYIIGNMETIRAVAALAALAQETRLAIFRLLVQAGPTGSPAGSISEQLKIPAPTLSFHLAQLRAAGLTTFRREGRSLIYAADYTTTNALVAYLLENCCQSATSCVAPSCPPTRSKRSRSQQPHHRGMHHETPARARRRR
jgi:ArsR family transcriptional regulator, arsenate/arsenite/antimonite-responsive transcriptional repressor